MADPFEHPPFIVPKVDETGHIKLTPQEWAVLIQWLQKFKDYVQDNLP